MVHGWTAGGGVKHLPLVCASMEVYVEPAKCLGVWAQTELACCGRSGCSRGVLASGFHNAAGSKAIKFTGNPSTFSFLGFKPQRNAMGYF